MGSESKTQPRIHTHHDSVKSTIPRLDDLVGPEDGLLVEPAVIDPEVGEEVVIFLRDQAANIEKLVELKPFRLMIRPGVERNLLGQVGFILFWVSQPDDPDAPVISFVKCFNPHDEVELALWRRLADQGHWHLFLVAGNEMRDYVTFNNNFDLHKGLDIIVERYAPTPIGDPIKAIELFRQQRSIEDLMNSPDGGWSNWLVLEKPGARIAGTN